MILPAGTRELYVRHLVRRWDQENCTCDFKGALLEALSVYVGAEYNTVGKANERRSIPGAAAVMLGSRIVNTISYDATLRDPFYG